MLKAMYVMQIEPVCRRMDVLIAWQSHRHHGIVVLCRTGECDGKCLIVRPDAAVIVVNLHTSASGRCPDGLALPSSGLTKRLLQGTGLPKPSLGALLKNDLRKVARHSHPAFSPCQQHDKSHSADLSCPQRAKNAIRATSCTVATGNQSPVQTKIPFQATPELPAGQSSESRMNICTRRLYSRASLDLVQLALAVWEI